MYHFLMATFERTGVTFGNLNFGIFYFLVKTINFVTSGFTPRPYSSAQLLTSFSVSVIALFFAHDRYAYISYVGHEFYYFLLLGSRLFRLTAEVEI